MKFLSTRKYERHESPKNVFDVFDFCSDCLVFLQLFCRMVHEVWLGTHAISWERFVVTKLNVVLSAPKASAAVENFLTGLWRIITKSYGWISFLKFNNTSINNERIIIIQRALYKNVAQSLFRKEKNAVSQLHYINSVLSYFSTHQDA